MFKHLLYYLKRPLHFIKTGLMQGTLAQIKYRFPAKQIKIINITGTDGKTTTSSLVYHILNTANIKTGLISTVAAKIGGEDIDTGLHVTAPRPLKLNKFLRQMVDASCQYAVVEMTSHGAYQFRNWGVKPSIAGLTNITHEHLDYHLTYENYVAAKALLLEQASTVVLNEDDQSFYRIKQYLNPNQQHIITYNQGERLDSKIKKVINKKFPQEYNQMNARLAVKIAQQLEIDDKAIAQAIASFEGVLGRMQELELGQPFRVIIDFAHTPNAINQALRALQQQLKQQKNPGKLIAVFGSAGHRDQSKRPIMGEKAVKHADLVVITAEDPRTENIWTIIQQIKNGAKSHLNKIASMADRRRALEFALTELANKNDIVALLGKGPEKSLAIDKKELPWSDKKVATEILSKDQD